MTPTTPDINTGVRTASSVVIFIPSSHVGNRNLKIDQSEFLEVDAEGIEYGGDGDEEDNEEANGVPVVDRARFNKNRGRRGHAVAAAALRAVQAGQCLVVQTGQI
ncbi:hypothetical protein PtA15_3A219 [Puccinia triticina]|uniref:Uncharacterized protein n=1 Tax=Puccinia triticina TaxID=208348 RepID=A0ABY7CDT2_9BASI|nr:uncharacterized protein PtA15_3A217 [Puccinia triticina]XP_053018408.1 uncharacterized protein PtA15_3A218 [Puccinia triticina]XP_053018409.1 uncharacterized protein PtA15_3A219 [Puccinia triticina]WAQ82852.1 hypothetical protein PtA15_3A217 [Puccinia triticina]WAQ82853.1 hypothetical protein PtA15_3A218 [Puccinia triticina]WAQ82854.1 hypothetical protein PtA15_3A219 [Puccinia triticina]